MINNTAKTKEDQIKQHIDSFPVLPATVTSLIEATNDPESSAQDILEIIHPDQSLCLTVLKIANSALFGRPQKVDSIRMAIAILGFNEVQRIALTKAVINSFNKIKKEHKTIVGNHWTHSFVCGVAAKVIAKDLRVAPEIAFMGGLIHDIGKLIMLETFSDDYDVESWMTTFSDDRLLDEELNAFSFTHDLIGGQLLKQWCFPENLISAVAYHHRPWEATTEKGFAYIIQLADLLSFYCCNKNFLNDDIYIVIHDLLPDIQSQWTNCGLSITDDMIVDWFDWLLDNYEQSDNLKAAFSG